MASLINPGLVRRKRYRATPCLYSFSCITVIMCLAPNEAQKIIDDYSKQIEAAAAAKEKEILER